MVVRTIKEDIFGEGYKQPINQKEKGNRNERAVCKVLEEWVGQPFARVPSSGGLRWGDNSMVCGDVVCTKEGFVFPFSVETKALKDYGIADFLRSNSKVFTVFEQARRDAQRANKLPMVLMRRNGMPVGEYHLFLEGTVAGSINLGRHKYDGFAKMGDEQEWVSIAGWDSKEFFKLYPYEYIMKRLKKVQKEGNFLKDIKL